MFAIAGALGVNFLALSTTVTSRFTDIVRKEVKNVVQIYLIFLYLIDADNCMEQIFKLIANIWYEQIGKDYIKDLSAEDLLIIFAEGKLIHPESIRRCRAKIQQSNPLLRGKSYVQRKQKGEPRKMSTRKMRAEHTGK